MTCCYQLNLLLKLLTEVYHGQLRCSSLCFLFFYTSRDVDYLTKREGDGRCLFYELLLLNRMTRRCDLMERRVDTVFDHDLALGNGPLFYFITNSSFRFVRALLATRFRAGITKRINKDPDPSHFARIQLPDPDPGHCGLDFDSGS